MADIETEKTGVPDTGGLVVDDAGGVGAGAPETAAELADIPVEPAVEEGGCADAPEEAADCRDGLLSAMEKGFSGLELSLSGLRELTENMSSQLERNRRLEEHIDKLHAENQNYKSGLLKKILMPFVNEIIFMIDNYAQLNKNYAEKDISQIDTAKLLKQFGDIVGDLENALYKNGVEAYESEEGAAVDFVRQKVVKTVLTDDPQKHKTVCARVKKGFTLEDKIIRQEQVSCYKFENNPSTKQE